MIRSKPDSADLALAIILQDPILFAEFMRNTKDGSSNRDLWPKRLFKYRYYQRDLITDRSEGIILSGGRSIGKCAAGSDRLLTSTGYKSHTYMKGKRFLAWSLNTNNQLELKRAVCLPNGKQMVYKIQTASQNEINVTRWHPILTDKGFVLAEDLQEGDRIATITKLPHVQTVYDHKNEELRIIAYLLFMDTKSYTYYKNDFIFKSTGVRKDVERCCKALGIEYVHKNENDALVFFQKSLPKRHPITHLYQYFNLYSIRKSGWIRSNNYNVPLPSKLMELSQENTKNFLEALFAQYGEVDRVECSLTVPSKNVARQIQELLLRFGVETLIRDSTTIYTRDERAVYRFLTQFTIPGYRVGNLRLPPQSFDFHEEYRFDPITHIKRSFAWTYAVQVEDNHTYVVENLHTHNSLVLEDKILFDVINHEVQLEETKELVLTTANQNQLTPILDRLVQRVYGSTILKAFVSNGLNRQKGTFDLRVGDNDIRIHTRVAGSRGENNMVGLHLPRAIIDETQIFPINSFKQLMPAINSWQNNTQIFAAGVPNSVQNSTLYYLDQRNKRFKKYRIPAPNNPYFTYQDYIQAMKDYGGEDSDLFQQLILGRHGRGSEVVISRDNIQIEPFDFYNYAFRSRDKLKGMEFVEKLHRPDFKDYSQFMAGIDTGFVDPTIIQIFGLKHDKWYLVARYLLQRIETPEQEHIINWLDDHYQFSKIMIDLGAGGQGPSIIQSLKSRDEYKHKHYDDRIFGVQFAEKILAGFTDSQKELMVDTKTIGADELVRRLHQKEIVLSELDSEALSQLERLAKQKSITGEVKYFILGESGKGVSQNDHIFASFICFAIGIRSINFSKKKKKLGRSVI